METHKEVLERIERVRQMKPQKALLQRIERDIEFLEKTSIKPWFHFPTMLNHLKADRDFLTAWIEEQEADRTECDAAENAANQIDEVDQ